MHLLTFCRKFDRYMGYDLMTRSRPMKRFVPKKRKPAASPPEVITEVKHVVKLLGKIYADRMSPSKMDSRLQKQYYEIQEEIIRASAARNKSTQTD